MATLYRVSVSFEYVARAHNSGEAEDLVDEATRDLSPRDMTVRAVRLRRTDGTYPLPAGYTGRCLAYGDEKERPLSDLIEQEREEIERETKR
jgi:hypothetical protein